MHDLSGAKHSPLCSPHCLRSTGNPTGNFAVSDVLTDEYFQLRFINFNHHKSSLYFKRKISSCVVLIRDHGAKHCPPCDRWPSEWSEGVPPVDCPVIPLT